MKKVIFLLAIVCVITGCTNIIKKDRNMNAAFDHYKAGFVEALWKVYPAWASG